jgi:hypothetical protein
MRKQQIAMTIMQVTAGKLGKAEMPAKQVMTAKAVMSTA